MISSIRSLLCAVIYGIMENRLFFESHEDKWLLGHFKTYHLWMLALFITTAFDTNPPVWLWNACAMPFLQDLTWQLIERRKLLQSDWSNFGRFPLVLGAYLWYWVTTIALIILGVIIVVI